jgi:4-hydroxy-tetrahydrodipicolinate synthase
LAAGVHGLFAACQSSEVFYLSDSETVALSRFVVDMVSGRVPVVTSGHTASALSQQADQLAALAGTGVDGVILISNRLAAASEPSSVALENLAWLTERVPSGVDLGVYECPYPYKRLLSDDMVAWCAANGRYRFIKDTSCDLAVMERRVGLAGGSRLRIANANSQTLLASLRAGCSGYSGVMANVHPELYVWLWETWRREPEKAARLARYLSVAALAETLEYPVCAKDFQRAQGNFRTANCRSRDSERYFASGLERTMRQVVELGEDMKGWLDISALHRFDKAARRAV